jgi:hypothetical protein
LRGVERYVLDIEVIPLGDIDLALLGAYQDHELIQELARRGAGGLITFDDNMVLRPEVIEAIRGTRASVVTCKRVGDDPVRASGLLLIHLPDVAKRHRRDRAQIRRLGTVGSRPIDFADHGRIRERSRRRHAYPKTSAFFC